MKEIIPGIYTWSWLSPRHGYNFNGHAFVSGDGLIVIDPAIMEGADMDGLLNLGTPSHILLTNKDHERTAYELRDRSEAPIYVHERDSSLLKYPPNHTFTDGEILPGSLRAIRVPDNKSPGETALLLEGKGVLFVGDAIIGWPPGEFSLLPPDKYGEPRRAKESIEVLLNYDYDTVLVGDGESVLEDGKDAVRRFLNRDDVYLSLPVR